MPNSALSRIDQEEKDKRTMQFRLIIWNGNYRNVITIRNILSTFTYAAFFLNLSACGRETDHPPKSEPMQVTVYTVKPQDIEISETLSGRLSATEVSDVRPQIDGIIQKRLFSEGAFVYKGQPLYQIDPATYKAAYDTAYGTLLKAQATYDAAAITAKRYQALSKINGVSAQDVENYDAAAAEDRADVLSDKASLETARINLQRTRILAPISGKIGVSSYTEGALVTSGQTTALSTIQAIDTMYLDVTRTSLEGLRLRQEMASGTLQAGDISVQLILEDGSAYGELGHLLFSDVTVDPTTGSVTIRSVFPNPNHVLLPGMFVQAKLNEGTQKSALLIPQNVVTRGSDGTSTVFVVDSNNRVTSKKVMANTAYGNDWIVTSGLKAGDRVLTSGLQQVSAGSQVSPIDERADASTHTLSSVSSADDGTSHEASTLNSGDKPEAIAATHALAHS
jgi:membrane fusion protein (multidrug efflux system)